MRKSGVFSAGLAKSMLVFMALWASRAEAEWLTEQVKLVAAEGAAGDGFGTAIAVTNTHAIIGAPRQQIGQNPGQGAAYLYRRVGSTLVLQAKLAALDGAVDDHFGQSVSLGIRGAAVGAPNKRVGSNAGQGAVYFYEFLDAEPSSVTQLIATDGGANDNFGAAVAFRQELSLEKLLVGAPGQQGGRGAAYLDVRAGGRWSPEMKLVARDGAANDSFGAALSLESSKAVIGAPGKTITGKAGQGAVYVFEEKGVIWPETARLLAGDGAAGDGFGGALAMMESQLLVGAAGSSGGRGAAYRFTNSLSTWTQDAKLVASDGATGDGFGAAVSLGLNTMMIGAARKSRAGNALQGAVYPYVRSGSQWFENAQLGVSDGAAGDRFGATVATLDTIILIGAPDKVVGSGPAQGAGYLFMPGLRLGEPCTGNTFCASGACTDGICCDMPCGSSNNDCGACSPQGLCQLQPAETPCREDSFPSRSGVCTGRSAYCQVSSPPQTTPPYILGPDVLPSSGGCSSVGRHAPVGGMLGVTGALLLLSLARRVRRARRAW